MKEPQTSRVALDQAGCQGRLEAFAGELLDKGLGRRPDGGDGSQDGTSRRRKRHRALREQAAGVDRSRGRGLRPYGLEGRERVTPGCRMERLESGRRQRAAHDVPDHRAERSSRQRSERHYHRVAGAKRRRHVEKTAVRLAAAQRAHHAHPVRQAARGVRDDRRARRVQPLPIVHRDEHRATAGEDLEQRVQAEGDRHRLHHCLAAVDEERPGQRGATRSREHVGEVAKRPQKIGERRVGEPGLRRSRPSDQHQLAVGQSGMKRVPPQRRLADARLTVENRNARNTAAVLTIALILDAAFTLVLAL